MAYKTESQRTAQADFSSVYGEPDIVRIEHTSKPYGILWLHWGARFTRHPELADRNLFVKPDGTRLSWDSIT
jgi:hypothetical protein